MEPRHCHECGEATIYESMGVTRSDDVLAFLLGERNDIREWCSKCHLKRQLARDEELRTHA